MIADRADLDWARDVIRRHALPRRTTVPLSPVHGALAPVDLATRVLADRLDVRVGLQVRKYIWPPETRGV